MAIKLSFPAILANKLQRKKNAGIILFSILLFLIFQATPSIGQAINIQQKKVPLATVLAQITEQSKLNFSFSPKIVDAQEIISFSVKNTSLEATLNKLCDQLNIDYSILDKQIVLHRKKIGHKEKESKEVFSISGFVQDATSGESLIGATISVKGTNLGVSTNGFGFYVLQLPAGDYTLLFSYVGFEVQRMILNLANHQKQDLSMQPTSMDLPNVIVESKELSAIQSKQKAGMELLPKDLDQLPQFGGESGLVRGLQALPGVKTHSDGSAFFFVRGGAKDQNLIIMDDAPIYNPSHLFGFYSLVVPDFTKSISVFKSDIPVHLGDRLSSIIDIRTKDGNLKRTNFSMAFNPLIVRLSLEGPLKKDKSSYFLSYRGSNFNWLYKKRSPNLNIRFGDLSFKWNTRINNKNRLYYSFFIGDDRFENKEPNRGFSGLGWRNVASSLRWNHIFGDRLFLNTTLYSGNYNYRIFNNEERWESSIGRGSLKSDFTFYHKDNQTSRFGLEFNNFSFNPGIVNGDEFTSLFPKIQNNKVSQWVLYLNRSFNWADKWDMNIGFRFAEWQNVGPNTYFTFNENYEMVDSVNAPSGVYHRYRHIDPRLSLQYQIDTTSSFKFNAGIYHQNIQLISNSVSPFTAMEVWLPSSPNIKPQKAYQGALSYLKLFPRKGIEAKAELYYNKMDNQIDYKDHANTLLNPLLEGELRFGKMQSYGLEFMFKKKVGRLNGWFSYTYSRTQRQTPAINDGKTYSAFQDRPHDFSLFLNYALKRRVLFSAYATWYSGSAFSSPTGFYRFNDRTVPIYGKKHNDRLPNYSRLDIAFKFILTKDPKSRFQHDLSFSIYNFLAHKNIVAVNFNQIANGEDNPIINANLLGEESLIATQADLVRFFPSLTYTFKL